MISIYFSLFIDTLISVKQRYTIAAGKCCPCVAGPVNSNCYHLYDNEPAGLCGQTLIYHYLNLFYEISYKKYHD